MAKKKRRTSFEFDADTMAKLHYIVQEDQRVSNTRFVESYINFSFRNYIETHGLDYEYELSRARSISAGKRQVDTEREYFEHKKMARKMEIETALAKYLSDKNWTEKRLREEMLFYPHETVEEYLIVEEYLQVAAGGKDKYELIRDRDVLHWEKNIERAIANGDHKLEHQLKDNPIKPLEEWKVEYLERVKADEEQQRKIKEHMAKLQAGIM